MKDLHYRLDVNTLHRDEDRRLAVAQRDRPRHAAHHRAAVLRRLPPQPRHRLVHPRRRGHQRHRRRRHDPLILVALATAGIPGRFTLGLRPVRSAGSLTASCDRLANAAWCTTSPRRGSTIRATTKPRGRRTRPTRSRGSSSTCGIAPGRRVADVAAGTGKLTRLLAPTRRASCSRSSPSPGCARRSASCCRRFRSSRAPRKRCRSRPRRSTRSPSRRRGTGSTTTGRRPKPRASCAPGGRLGLVWNARDRSEPWVDEVWSIMDRVEKRAPWRDHENWRDSALRGDARLRRAARRPSSATCSRSRPRASSSGSRRSATSPCCPAPSGKRCSTRSASVLATHPAVRGREQRRNPLPGRLFLGRTGLKTARLKAPRPKLTNVSAWMPGRIARKGAPR